MNRFRSATILLFCLALGLAPTLHAQRVSTLTSSPLIKDYLTIDPNTGTLYVSNQLDKVSRVNADGSVTTVVDGLTFVTGVAFSRTGDLYFADSGTRTLHKRASDGTITTIPHGEGNPVGLYFAPDSDTLFVNTANPGQILGVAPDDSVTPLVTGLNRGITDVIRADDGNFYTADFTNGTIERVTPGGETTLIANLNAWVGYITYGNGVIYATTFNGHQVFQVELDGTTTLLAGTGIQGVRNGNALDAQFSEPNGLVPSITGDSLYISSNAEGHIRVISGLSNTGTSTATLDQPTTFTLAANYPNPFNPSTQIGFTLTEPAPVTLAVYDAQGVHIQTLVSGTQTPGTHHVTFDATGLASGTYFYTLRTPGHQVTRPMVLQK